MAYAFNMSQLRTELQHITDNAQKPGGLLDGWCDEKLQERAEELRAVVERYADSNVNIKTGRYHSSITVGQPYFWQKTGARSIRVYAARPAYHANLIEYGHRAGKKGQTLERMKRVSKRSGEEMSAYVAKGKYVFASARTEYISTYTETMGNEFAEAMEKLIQ